MTEQEFFADVQSVKLPKMPASYYTRVGDTRLRRSIVGVGFFEIYPQPLLEWSGDRAVKRRQSVWCWSINNLAPQIGFPSQDQAREAAIYHVLRFCRRRPPIRTKDYRTWLKPARRKLKFKVPLRVHVGCVQTFQQFVEIEASDRLQASAIALATLDSRIAGPGWKNVDKKKTYDLSEFVQNSYLDCKHLNDWTKHKS